MRDALPKNVSKKFAVEVFLSTSDLLWPHKHGPMDVRCLLTDCVISGTAGPTFFLSCPCAKNKQTRCH